VRRVLPVRSAMAAPRWIQRLSRQAVGVRLPEALDTGRAIVDCRSAVSSSTASSSRAGARLPPTHMAGGAAAGAALAAAAAWKSQASLSAEEDPSSIRCDDNAREFDTWAAELSAHLDQAEEIATSADIPVTDVAWPEGSRKLIFHTLLGKRKIERIRIWRTWATRDPILVGDERPGQTELHALVELGSDLCGHPEFVHGGMLSALCDELFGWTAGIEKELLGKGSSRIFTANLSVDYRKPVRRNGVYHVVTRVDKVIRDKKVYLKAALYDRSGQILTECSSLFIITGGAGNNISQTSATVAARTMTAPATPIEVPAPMAVAVSAAA